MFRMAARDPAARAVLAEILRDYPPEDAEGQADLAAALSLTPDEEPEDEA